MAVSLHVGKKRINTVLGSDGSTIPLGTLAVTSSDVTVATVSVDASNNVTVSGIGVGNAFVSYSAPGYVGDTETYTIAPLPSIVVTDGPEQ